MMRAIAINGIGSEHASIALINVLSVVASDRNIARMHFFCAWAPSNTQCFALEF